MATMTATPITTCETAKRIIDSTHHALIAGCTGCGKSNVMNLLITSILSRDPNEYQFVLIDTKRVELGRYSRTPHSAGFAYEAEEIEELLNKCLRLVEYRRDVMFENFQTKYTGTKLYIIIDELGDLLALSEECKRAGKTGADIFNKIVRLARIARAMNIQLICATQNINAKVIPTHLKGQLDLRVAVPVATAGESRVILDSDGAETLEVGEIIVKFGIQRERVRVPRMSDEEVLYIVKQLVNI